MNAITFRIVQQRLPTQQHFNQALSILLRLCSVVTKYCQKPKSPKRFLLLSSAVIFTGITTSSASYAETISKQTQTRNASINERINSAFIGDLEQIRERRIFRVLVSYNRTNFFHSDDGTRGLEFELMSAYEKYLNRGPRKERFKTHFIYLTRPFNKLFDSLLAGEGDIIAAGLTITPERKQLVDFTKAYIRDINEVLVANKDAEPINRFEDLAGKQIVVVANSSYIVQLQQVNQVLGGLGLDSIEVVQANELLEAEDILEMVNAGLFPYTIVDSHIAKIYSRAFKNLKVQEDMILRHGGQIAWAINKNLPKLKTSLNDFIEKQARPGRYLSNVLYRRYFENESWIQHPLDFTPLDRTPCLQYYFEKYSQFYDFDWHMIAAQAYKESKFDQSLVSRVGAYGIMQIRASTANSKHVAIKNTRTNMENNIHAGIRYLSFLRDHYFDKPEYAPEDKINFSLAAYNAGPGRIRQLQRIAKRKGLNPNKWFYNVETIARNEIGLETVNYVTFIQKTSAAIKLAFKLSEEKRLLKQEHLQELQEQQDKIPEFKFDQQLTLDGQQEEDKNKQSSEEDDDDTEGELEAKPPSKTMIPNIRPIMK
ncbi:transglycosylase SLT domain-containing protein [Thiomicrorhabdus marina]|uniref:transglycosylase SLT domain-containing protein n=1 Tax=Thiomicrorhabdus marina TaxID=2818442 RepID=UPI001FB72220|nr:transporter substrate-binding domain-containing protein [Thiomicrorhabdus marina]